jgi:hypothetical protein
MVARGHVQWRISSVRLTMHADHEEQGQDDRYFDVASSHHILLFTLTIIVGSRCRLEEQLASGRGRFPNVYCRTSSLSRSRRR